MSITQINKHYEEQRSYPRLKLNVPVIILCANRQLVEGHVYDISPDGLQIRCNRETALTINPGAKQISPLDKVMVQSIFSLPSESENKEVRAICNIYYFTLLNDGSDKDVAFGLKFKKFAGNSNQYVDQFIMNEMEPAV